MKTILTAICSVSLLTGCVSTQYSDGATTFKRVSFGSKTSLADLTVAADTNGVKTVKLKGYQNDSAQIAESIARGVAEGLAK